MLNMMGVTNELAWISYLCIPIYTRIFAKKSDVWLLVLSIFYQFNYGIKI